VARTWRLAPPFRRDPPRPGDGDDASTEPRPAHEAGDVALREDLERARGAEHAHDEEAGGRRRGGVGGGVRRGRGGDGLGGGGAGGRAAPAPAARPGTGAGAGGGGRGGGPRGRGAGWYEEPQLRCADALGYGGDRHTHDGGARRPALERDAEAAQESLRIARR